MAKAKGRNSAHLPAHRPAARLRTVWLRIAVQTGCSPASGSGGGGRMDGEWSLFSRRVADRWHRGSGLRWRISPRANPACQVIADTATAAWPPCAFNNRLSGPFIASVGKMRRNYPKSPLTPKLPSLCCSQSRAPGCCRPRCRGPSLAGPPPRPRPPPRRPRAGWAAARPAAPPARCSCLWGWQARSRERHVGREREAQGLPMWQAPSAACQLL